MDYGLCHDIPDWHEAEVVLILKGDKVCAEVVKSWRILHLLPTLAKVAERVVLLWLSACVDLGET